MRSNDELVDYLIRIGVLKTDYIIKAFREIDRKDFVREEYKIYAYEDIPLPIAFGQTISQPFTVAFMTEALEPKSGQKILEIGTGSGYQAAILAKIVGKKGKVITIERIPELAEFAKENLKKYNITNVEIVIGDGSLGFEKEAPYDRIIVTGAFPQIPNHLLSQLKEEGIIIVPVGYGVQRMKKIVKKKDNIVILDLGPFRFVPIIGEKGFRKDFL